MPGGRKLRKLTPWLWTACLVEPFGALPSEVVDANPLKNMVGLCGLEPQTSTVSNPNVVRDGATQKKSE
jgi:hypothetical protein